MNGHVSQGKEGHGITIGLERIDAKFILTFKVKGKLTHQDYVALTPLLDSALSAVDTAKIKMLVDISEFSGWELRAAWDDFKLGATLDFNIDKVAIYGDKNWQTMAAQIGSWFISGEMQSFADRDSALNWLTQ
uniref:STAS/SEC14 domain-containing protein n=1 Tax=Thaumasiovibrio occultus TaxID=1891184 RepID=UPI000B3577ED|nr:STAS/SEC14 domain-containing protein [Thaumasiovibrio occultus]